REEKRRFFAGWIHFRLLIRFDRLKKKIFTDVEGRIISGSGRCFNTIWRMNKNKDRRASAAVIPARAGVRTACSANEGADCAPVR
ncbi:hypothetical protein, partial [Neisseria gonorrhoeae]|uniref:hypothetical protein n=1 Tax=Neisseria gonorrhoeae TaxID=485 RepID=UPI001C3F1C3C